MGHKLIRLPSGLHDAREQSGFGAGVDHFTEFTDAQRWTVAVAGTGTAAHEGSAGKSRLKLFNTAANDAAVIATTHEIFKFVAGSSMFCEGMINGTDVDTDDGMFAFGWADALAATTMADTTGAITATDAALIYKAPDSRVFAFHTEIGGVSSVSVSTTTALTGVNQILSIDIQPQGNGSSVLIAIPKVDGKQLRTSAGTPISHTITLGTATDLDFGAMIKSNDAADYTVYVEYLSPHQIL